MFLFSMEMVFCLPRECFVGVAPFLVGFGGGAGGGGGWVRTMFCIQLSLSQVIGPWADYVQLCT